MDGGSDRLILARPVAPGHRRGAWRGTWRGPGATFRTAGVLAAIALAAAWWAAQIGTTPDQWLWNLDMPKIDFPLATLAHEALTAGRLPLWSDRLGLGFPLYAEGQIGAFYPPSWLLFQLPPLAALDATRVVHLAFAGLGAGLLVLRLGGRRWGAVVAVLVAVLGGAIVAKLEWHNLVASYAWMPWVLLPLVRRPGPSRRGLVAAGVAFGIQALAGHPNTWLLTGVAAGVILVANDPWRRGAMRAAGLGLLGAAVGAVQLVPTAVLTTLSVRSTALTPDDLFAAASTPFDPLGVAFQGAFARMADGHWDIFNGWYPDGVFAHLESAAYLGLPVVALVATGVTIRRARPLLIAAAVLVAIPAIEAFKPEILLSIPFVNGIRSPVRAYVPASLLLGVVAGLAVGARPPRGRVAARATVAVGLFVGLWATTLALASHAPDFFVSVLQGTTTFGDAASLERGRLEAIVDLSAPSPLAAELVVGVAALAAIIAWSRVPRVRRLAGPVLAAVAAVPLLLWGPAPNGTSGIDSFTSAGSRFTQAVASAKPYRVLTIDSPGWYAGMPDELAAVGIADLRMFSSLDLRASDDLVDQAAQTTADATALRRALGIDTIVTFGADCPGREMARSDEDRAIVCHDDAALTTPYWIPADVVIDGGPSGSPIRPRDAVLDPAAVVASAVGARTVVRDAGRITATIDAPADGWAWVDVAWWPGWTATVDGHGVETRRALGGTLLAVPAGTHEIELALVPWDALLGLGIGAVGMLVAVAWARRDRRPGVPGRRADA